LKFLFKITIVISSTLLIFVGSASGQRVGGAGGTVKSSGGTGGRTDVNKGGSGRPIIKTVVVKERVTSTTGSLTVAAESKATVVVEPIKPTRSPAQQATVPDGERVFVFNDLKPGHYRVAGTLAGHHDVEAEVTIAANKIQSVTLDFQPILYSVIIKTNVTTGEVKYGPEGQPLTNVSPILNKTAELKLPAGNYVAEIVPSEFGYGARKHSFSLSADKTVLDLPLERVVLTTDTLSPTWTAGELREWEMPATWTADSRKNLLVKGPGVALPRQESFRHYKDFVLASTAKMVSGSALSFALRAQDSLNYYLLQLTGEKSDDPFMVRLFVVKNGVDQRIRVLSIPRSSATPMATGQFFGLTIKMVDFAITVEIEDTQTGSHYLLGVLTDPNRTFPVGAVGIAGRNNEDNVIGRFVVCTGDKCFTLNK
jgi:hypothetical protein